MRRLKVNAPQSQCRRFFLLLRCAEAIMIAVLHSFYPAYPGHIVILKQIL